MLSMVSRRDCGHKEERRRILGANNRGSLSSGYIADNEKDDKTYRNANHGHARAY